MNSSCPYQMKASSSERYVLQSISLWWSHENDIQESRGIFQYDCDIGFLEDQALPTRLKTLRTSIRDHFYGTHHARKAVQADWVSPLAHGRFDNNQLASHVMRTGYFSLKKA